MNLFWLRYVSYASIAAAAYFYSVLRLNRVAILSRAAKLTLFAASIALACLAWHVQESNAQQNSPRRLLLGTIASVSASHSRGGAIRDTFQLRLDSGGLSPSFSTDNVADSDAAQPIHPGDTLGVLYRTWDNVPLTIDELQGSHAGWHYARFRVLDPYVWAVAIAGLFAFLGLFVSTRKRPAATPVPETTLHLSD